MNQAVKGRGGLKAVRGRGGRSWLPHLGREDLWGTALTDLDLPWLGRLILPLGRRARTLPMERSYSALEMQKDGKNEDHQFTHKGRWF